MKAPLGMVGLFLCFGCRQADPLFGRVDSIISKSIETRIHRVSVQFIPRRTLLLSRADTQEAVPISDALIDSLERAEPLPGGLCFLLTIASLRPSSPGDMENDIIYGTRSGFESFKKALAAYQTGWQDKIWIEAVGRKYPLASYQMENTFGMTPYRNFTLVFPDISLAGNESVILVLDGITPGMAREKLEFEIPMERYAKVE